MKAEPALPTIHTAAPPGSAPAARALGALCLGAAVLALLRSRRESSKAANVVPAQAGPHTEHERSRSRFSRPRVVPAHAGTHAEFPASRPVATSLAAQDVYGSRLSPGRRTPAEEAAGTLHHAAALLALSVLLDSAVEHYRADFENPGMFAPLATSLATLFAATRAGRNGRTNTTIYTTALAIGAAGTAFHVYNLWRRPGRFNWQNLFYAAPLGAPAALGLSGALGLAAGRVASPRAATIFGVPSARALCALSGIGLAGTAAEAGLLHFRGAYHRPAMWLPVTVPPVGAAFLLRAAVGARDRLARAWLGLTALLGIAGVAFHANGIARQMGGWRNWRQNLLSGPPLPAPPSFLALALAGRAALSLEQAARSKAARPVGWAGPARTRPASSTAKTSIAGHAARAAQRAVARTIGGAT